MCRTRMDKKGGLTMNREQAKELLPIIQAFAEGKTIQVRSVEEVFINTQEVIYGHLIN